MAVVDYGNVLTECLTTDGFPIRPDGWFLKHLDTGQTYFRRDGAWELLALGLSFAPPTKSGRVVTDAAGEAVIAFVTPFIDNVYTIALTCGDNGIQPIIALMVEREPTGFTLIVRNTRTGQPVTTGISVAWLATKDYNA